MRDIPQALMLFTAGFGTRMGALTRDRPKPLIPVAGRPLVDHALELVQGAGIQRVVANTHYMAPQMQAYLAPRGIAVSHEAPEILETGGGLRHALPLLGAGPVFTLNSDAVWTGPNPLARLAAAWDPARMDALLMLVPCPQVHGHTGAGDFLFSDPDTPLQRGPGLIYSGAQIIRTDLLAEIEQEAFSLNLLWDRMLGMDRVFGIEHMGHWCDVGTPEGIAEAEAMLAGQQDV